MRADICAGRHCKSRRIARGRQALVYQQSESGWQASSRGDHTTPTVAATTTAHITTTATTATTATTSVTASPSPAPAISPVTPSVMLHRLVDGGYPDHHHSLSYHARCATIRTRRWWISCALRDPPLSFTLFMIVVECTVWRRVRQGRMVFTRTLSRHCCRGSQSPTCHSRRCRRIH